MTEKNPFSKVPQFNDRSNFTSWRIRFMAASRHVKSLYEALDHDIKINEREGAAELTAAKRAMLSSYLVETLSDDVRDQIDYSNDGLLMWINLNKLYQGSDDAQRSILIS